MDKLTRTDHSVSSEPVRVLNLFTILDRGGAETMVMNYYRRMDRSRVQFDFLVHRPQEGAYEKEILSLGGRIYRLPGLRPGNFSAYYKEARAFFKDHPEYRILHAHMSELACIAFMAAAKEGVPVRICHAHNAPREWNLKAPMKFIFKHLIRRYATHLFTCGRDSGDWLYGRGSRDRFVYLHNAIETGRFGYNALSRERLRSQYGFDGKLVLGHVGRMEKVKNQTFLLDILKSLISSGTDAVCLLIGKGSLEEKLREKTRALGLEERVFFMGARDDVADLLQMMDAFVFPSYFEGASVSLIEAQTAGLPCFVSAEQSQDAVITESVCRISLKEPADTWAERIKNTCAGFERKDAARKIREAGYDIDECAGKLEEFYRSVVNGTGGSL
jgi:glycosyltransferase involved in cell wall biosynthesis